MIACLFMISQPLPPSLRSISCREERNKDVMKEFAKLSKQYDCMYMGKVTNELSEEDLELQSDENEILNIVDKARNALKYNEQKKTELLKKQSEYIKMQENCEEIIQKITNLSNIYYPLSVQIQNIPEITSKMDIQTDLYDVTQLKSVKDDIDKLLVVVRDDIDHINQKMLSFKKLVRKCLSENEMNVSSQINICDICNTNKINICLNPCGHTFCNECIDKMNQKCGFCRNRFQSKIKIFLSENENNEETKEEIVSSSSSYDNSHHFAFVGVMDDIFPHDLPTHISFN